MSTTVNLIKGIRLTLLLIRIRIKKKKREPFQIIITKNWDKKMLLTFILFF